MTIRSKQNNQTMLKLFFIIGVFIGSLINLTDASETNDSKEEKVIVINVND